MSDNTEQERAVVDAIRYATGDDCQMTDGEAAVAIKALASAGYVLVERQAVIDAAEVIDDIVVWGASRGADIGRYATRLRRAAAAGNGEGE